MTPPTQIEKTSKRYKATQAVGVLVVLLGVVVMMMPARSSQGAALMGLGVSSAQQVSIGYLFS